MNDKFIQFLVMLWLNEQCKSRRDKILTSLEDIARERNVDLIRVTLEIIAEIAEEEKVREMASPAYYAANSVVSPKKKNYAGDLATNNYFDVNGYFGDGEPRE